MGPQGCFKGRPTSPRPEPRGLEDNDPRLWIGTSLRRDLVTGVRISPGLSLPGSKPSEEEQEDEREEEPEKRRGEEDEQKVLDRERQSHQHNDPHETPAPDGGEEHGTGLEVHAAASR